MSQSRQFLFLAGFDSGLLGFGKENKNKLMARSPDPYEYKTPEEYFAVNLEYFALDPEYACRKPTFNRIFTEAMGPSPAKGTCIPESHVEISDPLSGATAKISIDPKRVYAIDYLLAAEGESMESKWGHAMFRIVVCRPERKQVGPECRKDLTEDVVVSFRANIGDFKPDYWKGFKGGY
ncbi:MAG: hypothetical protein AABZ55_11430, partial [Bdellovibrionota bacterium]